MEIGELIESYQAAARDLTLHALYLVGKKVKDILERYVSGEIDVDEVENLILSCQLLLKVKKLYLIERGYLTEYEKIANFTAKMCCVCHITNSELVCGSMKCVYDIIGNFSAIYDTPEHLTDEISSDGDQGIKKCDFSDDSPLAYFLKHANKGRLTFEGGLRFVDAVGLCGGRYGAYFRSARHDIPELLLLLLRYGFGLSVAPLLHFPLINAINFVLVKFLLDAMADVSEPSPDNPKIRCVAYILRSIRCSSLSALSSLLYSIFDAEGTDPMFAKCFVQNASKTVPALTERFLSPASLKHLCRWRVRKTLMDNWNLPDGIRALDVPDSLKNYLDLLEDD